MFLFHIKKTVQLRDIKVSGKSEWVKGVVNTMNLRPETVVKRLEALASLPDIVTKINDVADDPNSTTQDMQNLIQQDPALTARLLKIANSAFYGFPAQVDTINRAVMVVGTNGIRDLVWATSAMGTFAGLNSRFVDMRDFWRHSLYVATVARVLATKCRILRKERFFLAGLLHDIGRLALYHTMPDEIEAVLICADNTEESLCVAEKKILGFDHTDIGEALLKQWKLPENVQAVAKNHHHATTSGDYRLEVAVVHIADNIAKTAGVFGDKFSKEQTIDPAAWHVTGLSEKIIDSTIGLADEQYKEVVALFSLNELASAA